MQKLHKLTCLIGLLLLLLPSIAQGGIDFLELGPALTAESAILLDLTTGKVLHEKNADRLLYPASTTKILTALLLVEHVQPDDAIIAGDEVNRLGPQSSVAGIEAGNRLTAEELVYGLMLPSGNDAAYTAAVLVARRVTGNDELGITDSLAYFQEMMNERARELGATNTNFVVPDGYHHPDHMTTARDLALISLEAVKHQLIMESAATLEYQWQGISWPNTNRMLDPEYSQGYYPQATGLKLGYTPQAGHCVVATASADGRDLLMVVMNSTVEERWQDSHSLLDYGFESWQQHQVLVQGRQVGTISVQGQLPWETRTLDVVASETYEDLLHLQQIDDIQLGIDWNEDVLDSGQKDVTLQAPIRRGQVLGTAIVSLEGEVLAEVEVVAARSVKTFTWWLPLVGILLAAVVMTIVVLNRRKMNTHP